MLTQIAIRAEEYLQELIVPLIKDGMNFSNKIDERGILISMNLSKEDMGKVIGKNGETIKALRRLVKQFGMVNQANIAVKVNEPICQ